MTKKEQKKVVYGSVLSVKKGQEYFVGSGEFCTSVTVTKIITEGELGYLPLYEVMKNTKKADTGIYTHKFFKGFHSDSLKQGQE